MALIAAAQDQFAPSVERPEPVIEAAGIVKTYGNGFTALRGVDFSIRRGERVALIGPNGSGKSTLLKCLIGLLPISGGSAKALGQSLERGAGIRRRTSLRRQVGFVFQSHCLVRRRSALSNVVHGMFGERGSWRAFSQALAPSEWRERAMAALDEVGLAEKALSRADALSGGQQQRVAIARALVRKPRLIIADEPAASLDPVAGRDVMELFVRLARAHGATLLFTSHDMEHANAYADRIVGLEDGRITLDRATDGLTPGDLDALYGC